MGLKSVIQQLANRFGYEIQRVYPGFGFPNLPNALERWKSFPLHFESLIDVGASNGLWSLQFKKAFPGKHYLLVDANHVHEPALRRVCSVNPNWSYKLCAVGSREGCYYFDDTDPFGGHLSEKPLGPSYKPCPVSTLDGLVREFNVPLPTFIKLDTHGVEIPILEGASQCLHQTAALAIEVYNSEVGPPQVPFWELCRYLRDRGFRPLDLWDIMYRPKDKILWQFDVLFVREDCALFQDTRYS